jgi:hypothetical protein
MGKRNPKVELVECLMKSDLATRTMGIAVLLALGSTAHCGLAVLDRNQFAAGWPIELPGQGPFFDILLTHDIYQHGRGVEELAVLDQKGEAMPFYLVGAASGAVSEEGTRLGVSPIYLRKEEETIAGISVATTGDGTDVTVIPPDPQEGEAEVVAFIVDARDVAGIPSLVELEWRPLDRPFLMSVSVEHSQTLTEWRHVGEGSVATLVIDAVVVNHTRLAVKGQAGGYYRVTWDQRVRDWHLDGVVLISSLEPETAYSSIDLPPVEVPKKHATEDALLFDVGGRLPATHAQIVFPKHNRWVTAGIHAADRMEGPWRPISRPRLFYDVAYEGERLVSTPLHLGRVESRYFRLTFVPEPSAEDVKLRLRYPREHLRFAANGQPPYMLVGGTLSDQAGPDPTFAAVMDALDRDEQRAAMAVLGPRVVLGGDRALETSAEFPWKSVLLWSVLLMAAVTVGWMAVRLAREMSAKS